MTVDFWGGLDTRPVASLWWRRVERPREPTKTMRFSDQTGAILTDSHFLIPLVVFCIGLALLITLH
jgi:hypothetical protein